MIVYMNTRSKKTKKQMIKEKIAWQQYQTKYGLKNKNDNSKAPLILTATYRREVPYVPSLGDGIGNAVKKDRNQYTGNKMLGVACMHKSNLVPIFNDEAAIEVANMRRG
jgi:hypothetical protein